ncbi:MAG TPA: hypothetical protein VN578_02165 [Candidatus Binatia bacterium]|nr:hypothetical protein [Candidatus Binatia bacterium]
MTKAIVGARRSRPKMPLGEGDDSLFPRRTKQSLIQWPSEEKIQEVSKRLSKISRMGIRSEANGDYFNSGDLAYQMQEIIRATDELFKKSQRLRDSAA